MALRAVDSPWRSARDLDASDQMTISFLNTQIHVWTVIQDAELLTLAATPWWKPWRLFRVARELRTTVRCLTQTRAAHDALRWG